MSLPEYTHVESILVVHDTMQITLENDWQVIGGPTLRFDLFGGQPHEFFAWIGGSFQSDWCSLEIRVVEKKPDNTITTMMAAPVILPNTQNTRTPIGVPTTVPPTSSGNVYQVEARVASPMAGKLHSAWLSNLTLSLLRWEL